MAILKFNPGSAYLKFSGEEIAFSWDCFLGEFGVESKHSLSIYGERHLRAVQGRSEYLLQSSLDNDLAVEYMAARLAQKQIIRHYIGGRYSEARATAFVVLYMRLWHASSASEKKELRGRLVSALKDSSKWNGLYFELVVGEVYLFAGVDVEYCDVAGGGKGRSADLHVSKDGVFHSVELKTINYMTGFPIGVSDLMRSLMGLVRRIEDIPAVGEGFVVDVLYSGERQPSGQEIDGGFREAASKLTQGELIFGCGDGFSVFSKRISADEMAVHESYLDGLSSELSEFDLSARSNKNGRALLITFRSNLKWDITKRISNLLRAATKQIEGRGIVWIQVCGIDPAGGNFKKLDEITLHNEFLQSECMKLEERGKLLICHIAADAGARFIGDQLILDLRNSMLGAGKAPPNVIQHYWGNFCTGRK